jgi:CRP-like cAMP-binding protein
VFAAVAGSHAAAGTQADDPHLRKNVTELMKKRTAESFRKYKVPFFSAIPFDKYAVLARLCEIETLDKDAIVFAEGDVGSKFYLILHGECRVTITKPSPSGERQQIELYTLVSTHSARPALRLLRSLTVSAHRVPARTSASSR